MAKADADPAVDPSIHTFRVPYADVDQMGFVYYANYLVYFEMARSHMLRHLGLPYPELERQGIMLPVLEAHCDYKTPAHYDDRLSVHITQTVFKGPRLRIEYVVTRDEDAAGVSPAAPELLATGYTVHVCMSPEGRVLRPTAALKAIAFAQHPQTPQQGMLSHDR